MLWRVLTGWRAWARRLQAETYALYLAYRDPRVPWYARLVAAGVVAYALSPLDLIPDFVPVLGHLDDLVLVPLGLALALRLVPAEVLAECRARARAQLLRPKRPSSRVATAVVVGIWLLIAALAISVVARLALR
ncbi:MAG TPA: YkvA family protein [Chloroflexota bacterium]|nr:YkvA family protein [Chloroflexota bacterium]